MVTELKEGVWQIECTGVNAYLVADTEGLTLIDTGTPFDKGTLRDGIESAGFLLGDLSRILITHFDIDHVGTAAKLARETPVYVGQADADLVSGIRRPRMSLPKGLSQLLTRPFIRSVSTSRIEPVEDGETIGGFTAYQAPGHTPGHTVYIHADMSAAFLGDLVVERDGVLHQSPWFLSADTTQVADSIRDVAARAPDFEVAAMGHGNPLRSGGSQRFRAFAESLP